MPFHTEFVTNRGGRKTNQDCCGFLTLEDGACWVVADGLGGHRGGEVASKLAVDTVLASFKQNRELSPRALEAHLAAAQNAILDRQQSDPEFQSMRTTIVVLLSDYRSFLTGYLGDSRLYYFQGGRIKYQTRDHSVPQVMVDAGEISADKIRGHEDRNRLLRALGMEGDFKPAVMQEKQLLYDRDSFLLCVDGFWEYVVETEMEADLARADDPARWLEVMQSRIQKRAVEGHDNYTAIAVTFAGDPAIAPPAERRASRTAASASVQAARKRRVRLPLIIGLGVAAIIIALIFAAVTLYRPFSETTRISNDTVARLSLKGMWVETPRQNHDEGAKQAEYVLRDNKQARLIFVKSKDASAPAPQSTDAPVEGTAMSETLRGVVDEIGCKDSGSSFSDYQVHNIGGKPIISVEVTCPAEGLRAFVIRRISSDDGDGGRIHQDIIFEAPAGVYSDWISEIKHAFKDIEWR